MANRLPEKVEVLLEERLAAGESIRSTAWALGVSRHAIRQRNPHIGKPQYRLKGTPSDAEVVQMLETPGATTKSVAEKLGLAVETVANYRKRYKHFQKYADKRFSDLDLMHAWKMLPVERREQILLSRMDRIFYRLPFHQKCLLLDDARYWIQAQELINMAQEARRDEKQWLQTSRKLLSEVRKWLYGGRSRAASSLQQPESTPDASLPDL